MYQVFQKDKVLLSSMKDWVRWYSKTVVERRSVKKMFFKNFAKFTGKQLYRRLSYVPVNFVELLRTHFFIEHLQWLPLVVFKETIGYFPYFLISFLLLFFDLISLFDIMFLFFIKISNLNGKNTSCKLAMQYLKKNTNILIKCFVLLKYPQ